jgi:hypothetical protein
MRLDDFGFALPREVIDDHSCEPRDAARLLHIDASGCFADRQIGDLAADMPRRTPQPVTAARAQGGHREIQRAADCRRAEPRAAAGDAAGADSATAGPEYQGSIDENRRATGRRFPTTPRWSARDSNRWSRRQKKTDGLFSSF